MNVNLNVNQVALHGDKNDLSNFIASLKYLNKIEKPSRLVIEKASHDIWLFIANQFVHEEFKNEINQWLTLIRKYNFDLVLIDVWFYLSNISYTFNDNENKLINEDVEFYQRCISVLDCLTSITRELVDPQYEYNSDMITFNKCLVESGLLEALLLFLKKLPNLNKINDEKLRDSVHGIFLIILNLSEDKFFNNKILWTSLNAEHILLGLDISKENYLISTSINKIIFNMNQEPFESSILSLRHLSNDYLSASNYRQSYFDFFNVYKTVSRRSFKQHHLFIENNFKYIFLKYLNEFHGLRDDLEFENTIQYQYPNSQATLAEIKVSIFHYILLIINKLIFVSVEVNLYLGGYKIIENLTSFLSDPHFLHKNLRINEDIILTLVADLSMLSKYSNKNLLAWSNLRVTDTLLKFLDHLEQINVDQRKKTKLIEKTYYCLVYLDENLTSNKIFSDMNRIEQYLEALLLELANITKMFTLNRHVEKVEVEYLHDTKIIKILSSYLNGKTLTGILDLLERFSIISKYLSRLVYRKCYFIKLIIYKGNYYEKYFSLRLLNKLCWLDQEMCNDLSRDTELTKYIQLNLFFSTTSDQTDQLDLTGLCESYFKSINSKMYFSNSQLNSPSGDNENFTNFLEEITYF